MILSVAGPIKDILVIITSATAFGSPVTSIQVGGFSLTLIGLYYYQKFKREPKEMYKYFNQFTSNLLAGCLCYPNEDYDGKLKREKAPKSPSFERKNDEDKV